VQGGAPRPVLGISALSLAGWLLGSWAVTGTADVQRAVFAVLSALVMGYPCAVGIAASLAIVRGSGEAADRGIIMRTGEAFQTFRQVTYVLLDKTGTLTVGRPAVTTLHPAPGVTADELLAVAAAAEEPSEHPLARAITGAARQRKLQLPRLDPERFQATAGSGVTAWIAGQRVLAGWQAFLAREGVGLDGVGDAIADLEGAGDTVIAVARGHRALGVIALGDTVRPEAAEAVTALRQAGLVPVLVTGDNPRAARHIARLGIGEVHAEMLPDGKAELAGRLQATGAQVAMVGDGLNDAPALMRADVGVALGSGTDIATDIIIVRDDLRLVVTALDISRRAYRRVKAERGAGVRLQRYRYPPVRHRPGLPGVGHGGHGRLRHQTVHQLDRRASPPAVRSGRQRRPPPSRRFQSRP
jgi:P-type E1-E2 ATPase